MLFINILIAAFGLAATLSAFGGDTWDKDEPGLIQRITIRGWFSVFSIVIAFSLGLYKEIHSHNLSIIRPAIFRVVAVFFYAANGISFSGLSATLSMGCQFRVTPDQRLGLRAFAAW
jgi:hypothetical protein